MTTPNCTTGLACRSLDDETSAAHDFFLISEQVAGQRVLDFSNTPHRRPRKLTNAQVFERVERFLRTGDPSHLPPALRPEAEGIVSYFARVLAAGEPPRPPGFTGPGPGASPGELMRALIGDRVDDETEYTP